MEDGNDSNAMLPSFFYGYMATQIFGGWWADRYGGKRVLAMGKGTAVPA